MYPTRSSTEVTGQVYLCFGCGSEFSDMDAQRKHEVTCQSHLSINSLHGQDLFYMEGEHKRKTVCEICRAYFSEGEYLPDHKLLHLNTDNICYLCETYHVTYKVLAHHVTTDHRDRHGIKQNEEGVNEPYMCPVCILRFSTLKGLQAHEQTHVNDTKTLVCSICKSSFKNDLKSVTDHLRSPSHANAKRKLMNVFTCIHCNTNFPTRDSYAMHMMIRAKDENCSARRKPSYGQQCVDSTQIVIKQEPQDDLDPEDMSDQPPSRSHHQVNGSVDPYMTSPPPTPRIVLGIQDRRFLNALDSALKLQWSARSAYYGRYASSRADAIAKTCDKCGKTFADRDDLAMHTMSVHTDEVESAPINPQASHISRCATEQLSHVSVNSRHQDQFENSSTFTPMSNRNGMWHSSKHREEDVSSSTRNDLSRDKRCHESDVGDVDSAQIKRPKSAPSQFTSGVLCNTTPVIVNNVKGKHVSENNMNDTVNNNVNINENNNNLDTKWQEEEKAIEDNIRAIFGRTLEKTISQERLVNILKENVSTVVQSENTRGNELQQNYVISDNVMSGKSDETLAETLHVPIYQMETRSGRLCRRSSAQTTPESRSAVNNVTSENGPHAETVTSAGESTDNAHSMTSGNCTANTVTSDQFTSDVVASESDARSIRSAVNACGDRVWMCRFCPVVFLDRTLYCLHMGMHKADSPYQCNMCGQPCGTLHDFNAHVLHFQ